MRLTDDKSRINAEKIKVTVRETVYAEAQAKETCSMPNVHSYYVCSIIEATWNECLHQFLNK